MLLEQLLLLLRFSAAHAVCSNFYSQLNGDDMNPALLQEIDTNTRKCFYNINTVPGLPSTVDVCDLTCAGESKLTALSSGGSNAFITAAHFDSITWKDSSASDLGTAVQFNCYKNDRCGSYVDGDGNRYPTRCNTADAGAVCNEDKTQPQCTCSPGYTGNTCGMTIAMYQTINTWLGPADTAKLLDIINVAHISPAAIVAILPSIYAFLSQQQKVGMSWSEDEIVESLDFEMNDVDFDAGFTQIFDEQLGNCYTFNYANETDSLAGLYEARFAGQSKGFYVVLKLDPSEQAAWIDSSAIATFIHAPGTPPAQGIKYALRGGASDLIALDKTITRLAYGCFNSIDQMSKGQNYYEAGDYTQGGCYAACYQDKVLEKCGCMDARLKKSAAASQCLFKNKDCVDGVNEELGDPASWSTCECKPECYQEEYTLSATRASMPYKLPSCANATDGCPDLSEKLARLTIYMESLESEIYVEQYKISFLTFLSNVGGQLGFLLGMSIVGVIEIIVLCVTLGKDACTYKRRSV